MASIEQIKDALEVQREQAAQVTERALSTVNSVVAFNSMTLTILAIVIGLLGFFGAVALVAFARTQARSVADKRVGNYIDSSEGHALIRRAVQDEVRRQLEAKVILHVQPEAAAAGASDFPAAPDGVGDQR